MRLLTWILLLAPGLAQAQGLPVLADFDQGQLSSLGGPLLSQQARLSLDGPGDYTTQGGSLRLEALGDGASVTLPLSTDGLILERASSSRSLIVVWQAQAAGTSCRVCLEGGTVAGELCATLQAADTAWHESALSLPPAHDALAFTSPAGQAPLLKVGALRLAPQAGSTWDFDEFRLDPPAEGLPAATVANAFGCSVAQVRAARRLGLPELATWTLLLLSQRCGLSPQALATERHNRSWGEISHAHGWEWGSLMDEVARRRDQAGLACPEASTYQELKVMDNHAFDGVRP